MEYSKHQVSCTFPSQFHQSYQQARLALLCFIFDPISEYPVWMCYLNLCLLFIYTQGCYLKTNRLFIPSANVFLLLLKVGSPNGLDIRCQPTFSQLSEQKCFIVPSIDYFLTFYQEG